jgi:hypothetical protein
MTKRSASKETSGKAGIGNRPDPTPEGHPPRRPDARPDPAAPGPEVGQDVGPEFGSTKTGPSSKGARQGGESRDTGARGVGGGGEWKNAGQGFGGGRAGRSFGNQPDIKEGDEVTGGKLRGGQSPAAGAEAGGVHVTRAEGEEER